MKSSDVAPILAGLMGLFAVSLRAQYFTEPAGSGFSTSYASEFSTTFGSRLKGDTTVSGDVSTMQSRVGFTEQWSPNEKWTFGLGPTWAYYSINKPAGAPLPSAVDSLSLQLFANCKLTDKWSVRLGLNPGIFSDFEDFSSDDFNMPAYLALGYRVSTNLLLVLGVSVNFRSELSTIGGPGVWWRFADKWCLNLLLPNPSVDYELTRQAILFAGGEIKAGGYRVAEDFGRKVGVAELDNDTFSYREIRVLGGLRYRFHRALRLRAAAGYTLDRRFEYRSADLEMSTDPAPFVEVSLNGTF